MVPADTSERIEQAQCLFRDYADATGCRECFEGFVEEVEGLPGEYAPPAGRLFVLEFEARAAGCVALRRMDDAVCEMKRLFVRAQFRGRGFGRLLTETIIAEARCIGYRAMRLDTLPNMTAARDLYRSIGFQPIQRYNQNPGEDVIFLEFKL